MKDYPFYNKASWINGELIRTRKKWFRIGVMVGVVVSAIGRIIVGWLIG